jgi:type I restriction enzyme R subunit
LVRRVSPDQNLTSSQIRFIETLIDQLTAQGVVDSAALYEPPFSDIHAGGPDGLFAGKDKVIEGIFSRLESLRPDYATA